MRKKREEMSMKRRSSIHPSFLPSSLILAGGALSSRVTGKVSSTANFRLESYECCLSLEMMPNERERGFHHDISSIFQSEKVNSPSSSIHHHHHGSLTYSVLSKVNHQASAADAAAAAPYYIIIILLRLCCIRRRSRP